MDSDAEINRLISQLAAQFLFRNYDFLWLRTMLEQAADTKACGATLITGSSHALNGIRESCWNSAYNCSMHSQDIYYDFQCARRVLERDLGGGTVSALFHRHGLLHCLSGFVTEQGVPGDNDHQCLLPCFS